MSKEQKIRNKEKAFGKLLLNFKAAHLEEKFMSIQIFVDVYKKWLQKYTFIYE